MKFLLWNLWISILQSKNRQIVKLQYLSFNSAYNVTYCDLRNIFFINRVVVLFKILMFWAEILDLN